MCELFTSPVHSVINIAVVNCSFLISLFLINFSYLHKQFLTFVPPILSRPLQREREGEKEVNEQQMV